MACLIGPLLKQEERKCTELISLESMKKSDFQHLKTALLHNFPSLTFQTTDHICLYCQEIFGRRRYPFCKHKNHTGGRSRSLQRLHFINVDEYFSTYRIQGYFPNDGICDSKTCANNNVHEEGLSDPQLDESELPNKKKALDDLNKARQIIDPTSVPVSFAKRNTAGQAILLKNTVKEVEDNVSKMFANVGLDIEDTTSSEDTTRLKELEQDSKSLMWIMNQLKERLQGCSRSEMKSLLTLVPPAWSIKKTSSFFGIGCRLVKNSRKRREETGTILPPTKPKEGRKLAEKTKLAIKEFYYQEDVSRACPGMRDVLSIRNPTTGIRKKIQKRYLLSNLKELHNIFKIQHPEMEIGLSTFCILRPHECISHSGKGAHNVCLCIHHENVKLLFNAVGLPSMKPYMDDLVCSTASKDCYYRRCKLCKGKGEALKKRITEDSKILAKQQSISYRRWLSTDGTHFVVQEKEKEDFTEHISTGLEDLLKHHYISKNQQEYLNNLKNNLKKEEIVVWGDFAENYSPVIQNAVQSEYFSHKQVTIHPFSIYWREENLEDPGNYNVKCKTICVISNCTLHDTNAVHAFQSVLLPKLQQDFNDRGCTIKHIHYFSDGCAAQYKNRKNFANLFHHFQDFGLTAEWHFHATAHGKGPCDAAGGTTKRLLRTASLQGKTITTAEEVFQWAQANIKKIEYLLITDDQVQEIVDKFKLTARYENMTTIAGTQQGHHFTVTDEKILMFETSMDTIPMAVKNMKNTLHPVLLEDCSINDWIGCVYDRKWYIAVVNEVYSETQEVMVTFWKSNSGPKGGKSFISENTSCYIPIGHVLKKLATPNQTGRRRKIAEVSLKEQEELDILLNIYLE